MKPVALITGGSRGIGLGIARKLCEDGFDVAINGVRDASQVIDVVDQLKDAGAEVAYCQGDVGTAAGRKKVLGEVESMFGRLNILVNNAGVAPSQRMDILDATEESYERVMRINLQGPYFLTQAAANWMIKQKKEDTSFSGSIINIGSISASVISPMRGEYCISKAGYSMHSKLWAVRLAEFDIPVYEVQPGIIRTDMTEGVTAKYDKLIEEGLTVQRRWGSPEDVGKAVLALANGSFPYSTGQVIMVDGGMTLQQL
ncbi:MAG: 3-ketoacyl-ACP reductase [Balneolales bacterium]